MKFPSTSGGAAGALVRGNEFYRNAPAPYSNTRRGQDTIHVAPDHIRVTRAPQQTQALQPQLLVALRLTDAQRAVGATLPGNNTDPADAYHTRRIHPLVLSAPVGAQQAQEWPQDELWQYPMTFQAKGHMVSVGDGYFVCVAAGTASNKAPTAAELALDDTYGSRIALVHKENLDGPYLNTATRVRGQSGHSLVFHRQTKLAGRGFDDRKSDILKDVFGANYFLEEARGLLSREWLGNWAEDVEGHTISVVPLGWMDAEHRYAFAVFGFTAQGFANSDVECLVYCTGKRALVRRTMVLAPEQTVSNANRWVGGLFSGRASACMTALGRGTMATVLMPRARYEVPDVPGLINHSVSARPEGVPPMLVWSTDFGATFHKRYLHEVEAVIARPFPGNAYFPAGGVYYPELKFHIEAVSNNGDFILAIAALNSAPSGDIPSAAYDQECAERFDAGADGPDYRRWWWPGDANRQSYMTLFKGGIHSGALIHIAALDTYQLRFGHFLDKFVTGRNAATVPPGTYRYNVLCNAALGACTPMLKAYASSCMAVVAKTIEVTVPPGWTSLSDDHDVYRVVETFLLTSENGGYSWVKSTLPNEHVSYANAAALGALRNPAAPNGAAADPQLLHLSWTVITPKKEATPERAAVPARIAVMVQQPASAALYVTDSPKRTLRTWGLRKERSLQPEPVVPLIRLQGEWDQGECATPSALVYLGDQDSDEFPDYLNAALPKLFE